MEEPKNFADWDNGLKPRSPTYGAKVFGTIFAVCGFIASKSANPEQSELETILWTAVPGIIGTAFGYYWTQLHNAMWAEEYRLYQDFHPKE